MGQLVQSGPSFINFIRLELPLKGMSPRCMFLDLQIPVFILVTFCNNSALYYVHWKLKPILFQPHSDK
jgi:hypothetical protein